MTSTFLHSNPVVSDILNYHKAAQLRTQSFLNTDNLPITRGLLFTGGAGIGKSYHIKKVLRDKIEDGTCTYIQGGKVTPASFFSHLLMTKDSGKVLVYDDVDLFSTRGTMEEVVGMLKIITEHTKGERMIRWNRITIPAGLEELGYSVGDEVDYQGCIVIITNNSVDTLRKKLSDHFGAISSRFNILNMNLDRKEILQYMLYLIGEQSFLGENCDVQEGGFSDDVINKTINFIRTFYHRIEYFELRTISKIAEAFQSDGDYGQTILETTMLVPTNN